MNYPQTVLIFYLLLINLTGAIFNIADKSFAKRNKRRIREKTLWLIGLFGGALLSYITMKLIRHKTKHKSFMIGFPLLSLLWLAITVYILVYLA